MPKTREPKRPLTRPRRYKAINAKMTETEHSVITADAERRGLTPTEWARNTLIDGAGPGAVHRVILEEVLAIRQILINVISHLATDGAVPSKLDLKTVAERADAAKFQKAEAAFARGADFVHVRRPKESQS